jgi:hypothetical protein
MKSALFLLVVSFSALGSECFVRTTDLQTNQVKMAREVCILSTEVKLEVFGKSKALIKYSLDGVSAEKTIELSSPIQMRDGRILFSVFGLEYDTEGSLCGETTESLINAQLMMNRDASNVVVNTITGSVYATYDSCHSAGREIESFEFVKH